MKKVEVTNESLTKAFAEVAHKMAKETTPLILPLLAIINLELAEVLGLKDCENCDKKDTCPKYKGKEEKAAEKEPAKEEEDIDVGDDFANEIIAKAKESGADIKVIKITREPKKSKKDC